MRENRKRMAGPITREVPAHRRKKPKRKPFYLERRRIAPLAEWQKRWPQPWNDGEWHPWFDRYETLQAAKDALAHFQKGTTMWVRWYEFRLPTALPPKEGG